MKMRTYKHCYIISDGVYEEIPYTDFVKDGKRTVTYSGRWFLLLHGCLMEVSQKDYKEFYKNNRRQKYLKEESILHREVSYNTIDTHMWSGEEVIVDKDTIPTDEIVVEQILIEHVKVTINFLLPQEIELIQALFYDGLSEREWSSQTNVPQTTINSRKHKILSKIKKMIKI